MTALKLRRYQEDAVNAVGTALQGDLQRVAVVLPTGGGKTVAFAHLARQWLRSGVSGKVVILAHRDELIGQAADKLHQVDPDLKVGRIQGKVWETNADVIVASVQTVSRPQHRWALEEMASLVIADECHHSSAPTWVATLEALGCFRPGGTPLVGFTATLARSDDRGLGDVFQEVVFKRGILDLIAGGHLVMPRGKSITLESLDLTEAKVSAGDYTASSLGDLLSSAGAVDTVAKAYVDLAPGKPGVCFWPTVDLAMEAAEALRNLGISALPVYGAMPLEMRRATLAAFSRGEVQVLTNAMVLTEGWDAPRAEVCVIARPTRSPGLFCLDAKTEILTDQGWKGVDDALDGVCPAAFDMATGAIHWSPLLAKVDRPLGDGERMFALSSPTADIRVSDRHRMVWRHRTPGSPWRISEAMDLASRRSLYQVPIAGVQDAPGVPLTDDELRFIGWVMTDGCINQRTGGITITQAEHQPWNKDIVSCLEGCGFKYGTHRHSGDTNFKATSDRLLYTVSKGAPRGTGKHLRGWGDLEPYLSKDLAPALEGMTRDQLAVMLHAMHLGNGAKQNGESWTRRSYHISTGNRTLADRLQSLCVRRGFKCNVAVGAWNATPTYVLHIKDITVKWVGGSGDRDREHLEESPAVPGERVWCVQTDAGTIVTRRNGKVAILGNCQMAGRVLRPFPGKAEALILDVVGATADHKLATLAELAEGKVKEIQDGESLAEAAEREEKEAKAAGTFTGRSLVVEDVDLFRRSTSLWLTTRAGCWFVPVANGVIFLWPTTDPDRYMVGWKPELIITTEKGTEEGGWLRPEPLELEYAMELAEDTASTMNPGGLNVSRRTASWRKRREPASQPQKDVAARLGVEFPADVSKRDLSDLITTAKASRMLDETFIANKEALSHAVTEPAT